MNQRPPRPRPGYAQQQKITEKEILQQKLAAIEAEEQDVKISIKGSGPQNPRQTKAPSNTLFALAKKAERQPQQKAPTNIHALEIPNQFRRQEIDPNEDIEVDEVPVSQEEADKNETAQTPEDLFPGEYFLSIRGDVTSSMDKLQIIRLVEQFLSASDSPYENLTTDEICILQRLNLKYGLTLE